MRVACYARYSSDLQRETSIADQLAVAARYAKERGWKLEDGRIYTDAAISGASIQGRQGIQRLLAAAAENPKPFDVVLVDDSSRVSRDIADAIRVMQQLKFLGIRVLYLSQGIDSESEQADALVAVHGLIDSMYLKELAKKVRRGIAGQMDRGFSTGAGQYGYDKIPVFDPSGAKDPDGRPLVVGRRVQVNEEEAAVIRRIFEWAADGVGSATIVDRLNREGVPGTRGKRWNKTPVDWILRNERYRGKAIWGQRGVEREPSTGRKVQRQRPRSEWKVADRPELRIVSDDLWDRVQATKRAVREALAPSGNLARGRSGKHHSKHLFTGFAKCAVCGGAMSSVSGGKGSPRLGCRRSWHEGTSACPNRLTIRIKVAEPQILAKLQNELLQPKNVAVIARAVEREAKKAMASTAKEPSTSRRRLEQERRQLENLVSALAGGSAAPSSVLKAIAEREKTIAQLGRELEVAVSRPPKLEVGDLTSWVGERLGDLHTLLKEDVPRVKAEFRRLNLAVRFRPVDAQPRPHYVVEGQCDLSALVFSFVRPGRGGVPVRLGAVLDYLRARVGAARNSSRARCTSSVGGAVVRSWRSTARRSSRRCSRRNCSGSRNARQLECAAGAASSNMRTRGRCSSTRCPTCPLRRSRNYCGPFRISRSSGWVARIRGASIRESSWRPIGHCRVWSGMGDSGWTCITASRASRFRFRRFASVARTSSNSLITSSSGIAACDRCDCQKLRSMHCLRTTGPATCASWSA